MDLEKEIELIKQRNSRVEADKAWEISWTRRLFIALTTYLVASVWLVVVLHDTLPFLKAFIPTVGYVLSTLSIRIVKQWWTHSRE